MDSISLFEPRARNWSARVRDFNLGSDTWVDPRDSGKILRRLRLPEDFWDQFPETYQHDEAMLAVSEFARSAGFDENIPYSFWLPDHLSFRSLRENAAAKGTTLALGMTGVAASSSSQGQDFCSDCTSHTRRRVLRGGLVGAAVAALAAFSPLRQRVASANCGYCGCCYCQYCYRNGICYGDYYRAGTRGCQNCYNSCYRTNFGPCSRTCGGAYP